MTNLLPTVILAIVSFLVAPFVRAQDDPPCLRPEHEMIAFLEGEWDVVSRQRTDFESDQWVETRAVASWTPVLDGCVLQERWNGVLGDGPLEWIQLLAYDYRDEKWEQVLIDTGHGNVITSAGFFQNGKLTFSSSQNRRGHLLIDRTTVAKVNSNQVEWAFETSRDGGKTWIHFWRMIYTRKEP